jgi:hypothetical protein
MALGLKDAGKSITRAIEKGALKSRLFCAQMALASLVAISGPEKVSISGPSLPMAFLIDIARIKISTVRSAPYKQQVY